MRKAILDSSFIISCTRAKIDFINELLQEGIKPLIPQQVIEEITKVSENHKKQKTRKEALLSLRLIEKYKEKVEIISLKDKKGDVDKKIIKFAEENPRIFVAAIDREIKEKTKNRKIVIRDKKKLEILE